MNFLFDENLPAKLARALRELGEPVRHVVDIAELGKVQQPTSFKRLGPDGRVTFD